MRLKQREITEHNLLLFQPWQPIAPSWNFTISIVFHWEISPRVNWFSSQALKMENCLNPAVLVQLQCELLRYIHTVVKNISNDEKTAQDSSWMSHSSIFPYERQTALQWEVFSKQIKRYFCKHGCLNINQSSTATLLKYSKIFWLSLIVILTVLMKCWCQLCEPTTWETAAGVIPFIKMTALAINLFPSGSVASGM